MSVLKKLWTLDVVTISVNVQAFFDSSSWIPVGSALSLLEVVHCTTKPHSFWVGRLGDILTGNPVPVILTPRAAVCLVAELEEGLTGPR